MIFINTLVNDGTHEVIEINFKNTRRYIIKDDQVCTIFVCCFS